jgi:hypothetical protein
MIRSLFLLLMLLVSASTLCAQELDTVRLEYRFTPGQVVTYRVVSTDSITMLDTSRKTFASERVEIVEYRCDTILSDGYVMTMTLKEYAATESIDGIPPVTRVTHPWVGRPVTFLMSPTGKRLNLLELSKEPGVAPGGPFAPLLLPFLGDSISHVGASASLSHAYWIFDNVYPPVYWKGTTFRVLPRRQDSPFGRVVVVSLSDVGTVAYKLPGTEIISQTVVNGAGNYLLSPQLGYMVGGFYELVGRITIKLPAKREVTGSHRMKMTYEMVKPG